ncbi:MAG: hypothetical protein AAFR61_05280 [Bacteroidota bacterium]
MAIPLAIFGQGIPVQEVPVPIFDRELSGLQFVLPQPALKIRQGIMAYFASQEKGPAVFEDMLIFEQIALPTVNQSQPTTLYFLTEQQHPSLTQLRVVGMFDYQRPLNHRDFPDLTLKLLLELDKLTQQLCGDSLDFDQVFQTTSAADILNQYEHRKTQVSYDYFIERKRDWVGDFGETRVKGDPFNQEAGPDFSQEDELISLIASRFEAYTQRNTATTPLQTVPSFSYLQFQDSLARQAALLQALQADMWKLRAQLAETAGQVDTLFYDSLIARISQLEKRPAQSKPDNIPSLQDSLQVFAQRNQYWRDYAARLASEKSEQEMVMAEQLFQLEQAKQKNLDFRDSLQALSIRHQRLKMDASQYAETQESGEKIQHSLSYQLEARQLALLESYRIRDSLKAELSFWDPDSEEAAIRRKVYQAQLEDMLERMETVEQREWEADVLEKRLSQREKYLKELEKQPNEEKLLQRISELEAALAEERKWRKNVQAKEAAPQPVFSGNILQGGKNIPAYMIRLTDSKTELTEKIRVWATLKGFSYTENPLQYTGVTITELSPQPVDLAFSFLNSREQGTTAVVCIRLPDQAYLSLEKDQLLHQKAILMVQRIFR